VVTKSSSQDLGPPNACLSRAWPAAQRKVAEVNQDTKLGWEEWVSTHDLLSEHTFGESLSGHQAWNHLDHTSSPNQTFCVGKADRYIYIGTLLESEDHLSCKVQIWRKYGLDCHGTKNALTIADIPTLSLSACSAVFKAPNFLSIVPKLPFPLFW
jgi:hypothetical protein